MCVFVYVCVWVNVGVWVCASAYVLQANSNPAVSAREAGENEVTISLTFQSCFHFACLVNPSAIDQGFTIIFGGEIIHCEKSLYLHAFISFGPLIYLKFGVQPVRAWVGGGGTMQITTGYICDTVNVHTQRCVIFVL